MKIVIITTETTHHTYFIQQIVKYYSIDLIIIEKNSIIPKFPTQHNFEIKRESYEQEVFFNNNKDLFIKKLGKTLEVNRANDQKSVRILKKIQPDIIIVFGSQKISEEVMMCCPQGIINLHGGDPEYYRGLDSHLWAIYHDDYSLLVTTLHHLNAILDDGDIILQSSIRLNRDVKIYQLRHYNTNICIELVLSGLDMYKRFGHFISRPQNLKGRYYSFMPSVLKDLCEKKFEHYIKSLP